MIIKRGLLLLLIILLSFSVIANEKYSFEKAEELTPLIEWRDYGPKVFEEAIEQNKPILLLLTAPSWCYWCQVYESEDYLFNPAIVSYVNKNLIPVYVDADQRQDLTRQYLEGGWPSTTLLAPDGKRLLGYSGPRAVPIMLNNFQQAVSQVKRGTYTGVIKKSANYEKKEAVVPNKVNLENIINFYANQILQSYDPIDGGFGTGQKFPQGRSLDYALELYEKTANKKWLNLVENTLTNQYTEVSQLEFNYNLFDPIDGGFHRYGTKRDWTPPHYEKMLYDNARLLKAYSHLQKINSGNQLANEVVEKTKSFIKENWYDSVNGGFYGNSDVHGEDAYYGKNPRSADKPRVEKTKYSNWNGEAILTYLYIGETEMAGKSLDLFANEMIDYHGAYHYYKDGKKSVQGNLLDNSYLLLAFVNGYEKLDQENYLVTAEIIADYLLNNLYDWHGGGFFERNSQNLELYAPGENILLDKPAEENGITAYALLKLYQITEKPIYLSSALKTIGVTMNYAGGLDRGYYHTQAAQFILINNLLDEYNEVKSEVEKIEQTEQERFWLTNENQNVGFTVDTDTPENLDSPLLMLILVALISGFISFASPCSLPILPAFLAYSFKSSEQNLKGLTFSFFLGLSLVFTLLGTSASLIGSWLKENINLFSSIAGLILIFFGIFILMGKGFTGLKIKNNKPTTYLGSFIFGMVLGISWTPCVGPILVAILVLAAANGYGGILLFSYCVGLALPLLLFSFYLDKISKDSMLWRIIQGKELTFGKFKIHSSNLVSGLIFLALGYLIFSGKLYVFNQYLNSYNIQQIIYSVEEWVLNLIR